MAAGGLLALLDDIATLLDDVAVLSKVAAGKTMGITGDDLAVNSQAVLGLAPARELPVVWSVAKGSFKNKLILIPGALALNFVAAFLITPLLMLGGLYLCYEGVEKLLHMRQGEDKKHHKELTAAAIESPEALYAFEKEKIKGAIKTDLILSAEIIVVTLGTVATKPFITQVFVLSTIGIAITFGIYGLVAGIVKLDDLGLYLSKKSSIGWQKLGNALVQAAPKIMKFLGIAGTLAMLLVGGELILHGLPGGDKLPHGIYGAALAILAGSLLGLATVYAVKLIRPRIKAGRT